MKAAAARPIEPRPYPAGGGTTTIPVEAPLRTPISSELSERVHWLLRRGARSIVLDLSRVPDIDAAGAGELIRLLNAARAVGGTFGITGATGRVMLFLERAGVLRLLTADTPRGCRPDIVEAGPRRT
jgi:anti-anti-sigma regulatory factor